MEPDLIARGLFATGVGYLVGAVPFGIIAARLAGGADPRTVGSGRTGGANVLRAAGRNAAIIAGLLDLLKGSAAVVIARLLGVGLLFEIAAALAAVLGHSRSIFIGFGGGRGVGTGFGGLIVLQPLIAAAVIPVFVVVFLASRYSSLASLTASALAGLIAVGTVALGYLPPLYLLYAAGGTGMIWLFHADNIERLLTGRERKLELRR